MVIWEYLNIIRSNTVFNSGTGETLKELRMQASEKPKLEELLRDRESLEATMRSAGRMASQDEVHVTAEAYDAMPNPHSEGHTTNTRLMFVYPPPGGDISNEELINQAESSNPEEKERAERILALRVMHGVENMIITHDQPSDIRVG